MKKLSLCMIAKDEASGIGHCLESVRDLVDEMIVVDTGSTDETPRIAENLGAQVHHFQWNNNFSEARNYSLQLAQGDWILFLDADETLDPQSKEVLRQAITDPLSEGFFIKILNRLDNGNWNEIRADLVFRLFRNRKEYRFKNAIHEQILDSIFAKNSKASLRVNENIIIWHDGFREQRIKEKDKRNRNLALLLRELKQDPENSMLRFHYGEELFYAKRYTEAIAELRKASAGLDPHTHYVPKLLRDLITSHLMLNEHGTALQLVKYGLSHLPFFADLHYIGGLASLEIGDYPLAREYFKNAVHTPEQPAHYSSVSGSRGFLSYYQLGKIAEEFMEYDEALTQYTKSFQDNPNFTPALEKLIFLLKPRQNPAKARLQLEEITDGGSPVIYLRIGKILFQQSAFALALDYLEKGKNAPGAPMEVNIWRAVSLFQQHQDQESMTILQEFAPGDPQFLTAAFDLFLNYWLKKDFPQVASISKTLLASSLPPDIKGLVQTLKNLLAKLITDGTSEAGETIPLTLKDSGIAALHYILIRSLDLSEIELANRLLSELAPESLAKDSKAIGEIFRDYGFLDSASAFLKEYLRIDPESSETYYKLAAIEEERGKYLEAANYYRLALACNKDGIAHQKPHYYQALIHSYQNLRQQIMEKAVKHFPDHPLLLQQSKEV